MSAVDESIAPEELSYGIDVTGLDPASLTEPRPLPLSDGEAGDG